jgi:hypothetical protein
MAVWPGRGQPLPKTTEEIVARFQVTPFMRLTRAHAASMAGDTLITIALAGSLFFNITPDAARPKVALYLLLTMAPFAVVAPLIGPAIDRMVGGQRLMVVISAAGRCVVALLMARYINSLFLYPIAFASLVLSKAYSVSKSALVPLAVRDDAELVEANSKLGLISGVMGFIAAVPGIILLKLVGPEVVVTLAALVFAVAVVLALQLPRQTVAATKADAAEKAELRSGSIVLAASAMALLRGSVGFLTFQIAFLFRANDVAKVWFAVVLAFSALGALTGNLIGPALQRRAREQLLLVLGLLAVAITSVVAAVMGGEMAASFLAFAVGTGAALGRLGFDSTVQRFAPDANRGRAFAGFETRFQLVWVAAAFIPVVVPIPETIGYLILAVIGVFGAASYIVGLRHLRVHGTIPEPLSRRAMREARRMAAARRLAMRQGVEHPEDDERDPDHVAAPRGDLLPPPSGESVDLGPPLPPVIER